MKECGTHFKRDKDGRRIERMGIFKNRKRREERLVICLIEL
jgi:hypothetical protein